MQIPQQIHNHAVFRTSRDTAMIAFEAGSISDQRMVPRIHRYYLPPDHRSAIDHGRVFGAGLGIQCALLINVSPGSLIQTVERHPERSHMTESVYRIGPDFEVVPLPSIGKEISRNEIEKILHSSPVDVAGDLDLRDNDVRQLFTAGQPPWLQEIVDAQLHYWRIHNIGLFYRYTPWPVDHDDLRRCVKAAPYWGLARWIDRLQPYQFDLCVNQSPRGAISFAIERLSHYQRKRYLEKYPADALIHASDKLAAEEVLRFAENEPDAAITQSCRRKLEPKLRASVLARCFRRARRGRMTEPMRELERDILDSIAEFPGEWLAQCGSFANIMEELALCLSIKPAGTALIDIRDRMDPAFEHEFADYIGSLI